MVAVAVVIGSIYGMRTFLEYNARQKAIEKRYATIASDMVSYAVIIRETVQRLLLDLNDTSILQFNPPETIDGHDDRIPEYNVMHPSGGGIIMIDLPETQIHDTVKNGIDHGWYIGRFNDVGWVGSDENNNNDDVIMTAYKISREVCKKINLQMSGTELIPTAYADLAQILISGTSEGFNVEYHGQENIDLTSDICPECAPRNTLCVKQHDADIYAFYIVLAAQ